MAPSEVQRWLWTRQFIECNLDGAKYDGRLALSYLVLYTVMYSKRATQFKPVLSPTEAHKDHTETHKDVIENSQKHMYLER